MLFNTPYISLSYTPQPDHDPQILKHRQCAQPHEVCRVYYSNKRFFLVVRNKKNDRGIVGTAKHILRIIDSKFKQREAIELLVCHPTTFSKQQALQSLLDSSEQSLPKFRLLLT